VNYADRLPIGGGGGAEGGVEFLRRVRKWKSEIHNPSFFFFGCYPLIVFSINREQNSEIKRHLAFFL
jgi:hypothetical protein